MCACYCPIYLVPSLNFIVIVVVHINQLILTSRCLSEVIMLSHDIKKRDEFHFKALILIKTTNWASVWPHLHIYVRMPGHDMFQLLVIGKGRQFISMHAHYMCKVTMYIIIPSFHHCQKCTFHHCWQQLVERARIYWPLTPPPAGSHRCTESHRMLSSILYDKSYKI